MTESTIAGQSLSKNQMAAALGCAGESIVITDKEGFVQYVNPSFTQLTGFSLSDVLGQKPSMWRSSRHSQAFYADLWSRITSGNVWQGELTNRKKDNTTYEALLTIAPIFDDQHAIQGFVSTISEVSSYKKLQNELRNAYEEARRESSMRWRNLAYISHDIRTPLNGLLGLAEILEEKVHSPENTELLAAMKRAGQNILSLVDNILDDSRIDADKLQLDTIEFDIKDLLYDVQRLLSTRAESAHSVIVVQVPHLVPRVLGDANRVSRILQNLVGNATKFTENGQIALTLEVIRETHDGMDLRLIVADTGIGIDKEAQKRIFEQFSQADSSIYRKYGGSGLGLAITRKLVDVMHGEISVKSTPGQGTTFTVTLPFKKARVIKDRSQDTDPVPTELPFSGAKALVCDDDELNQKIMCRFLAKFGVEAEAANNGRDGLGKLVRQFYDIAFIDLQMPILDGQQMAKMVRENRDSRIAQTRLVAVTGAAHFFQETPLDQTCFDDYIVKPVTPHLILQSLKRLLQKN